MIKEEVLSHLAISDVTQQNTAVLSEEDIDAAIGILERMVPNSRKHFRRAIYAIVLRAIETRILCDPKLRQLALYWDALLGEADSIIHETILRLTGVAPNEALVKYVKSCVRSESSRRGGPKIEIPFSVVESVIEAAIDKGGPKIRCFHCGYHFCIDDVGAERQRLIQDLSGQLSSTIHPRRLQDALKPWQIATSPQKPPRRLTRLTIDHMTPEAGFGWTAPDNLVVACEFCNNGRAIYRRSEESLSVVVAGSLQGCPTSREHNQLRQIAIVAALIGSSRRCAACGASATESELTVQADDELRAARWLAPWATKVICYECSEQRAA